MKSLYLLLTFGLLVFALGQTSPLQAQDGAESVYLLTVSETEYVITALNSANGGQGTLFSVPASAQGMLPEVFPDREIDALNQYLSTYTVAHVRSLSELWMDGKIASISVSPDNHQVVAKVEYQTCFIPQNPVCFGTTQLVLIDRDTQEQRVLLNLGQHDDQFYPFPYSNPEVQVGQVQWVPTQQAIIFETNNRASWGSVGDSAIVVVPLNETMPFKIGDGQFWTVTPDGNRIGLFSNRNHEPNSYVNTLSVVDIDIRTGQFSETSYVLENYAISDWAGAAFLGRFIVFEKAGDISLADTTGGGGGLAVFDTQTGEASMVLPDQFFREIQSSPDGSRLVLETQDNLLVRAQYQNGSMALQPLVDTPVLAWNLGNNGDLLVQYSDGAAYQILDSNGTAIEALSAINGQRQATQASEAIEIIAIDW